MHRWNLRVLATVGTVLVVAGAMLGDRACPPVLAQGFGSTTFGRQSDSFLGMGDRAMLDLEQAWQRPLRLPAGADSMVDCRFHVHANLPDRYVEVIQQTPAAATAVAMTPAAATSAATPSPDGVPKPPQPVVFARILTGDGGRLIGGLPDQAEAERLARNEIRRLKRRGIVAVSQIVEVPRTRLYTLGDDGTIECRNAETGQLVWLQRVGNRDLGYSGMAVDDSFATVINGDELVKIDVANGSIFNTVPLMHAPTGAPVHVNGFAIVPSIGDRLIGYPIADLDAEPFIEIVSGGALTTPTVSLDAPKVVWGTDSGFVYALELSGVPNMQFRLNVDGLVSAPAAAAPGERFFFGSEAGQLYGLRTTRTGEVLWNRPTGEPIRQPPTVFGEQVIFDTELGNLISVSASDGFPTWPAPVRGIRDVMGIIDDQLFAHKTSGAFVVLSLSTGKLLHEIPGRFPRELLVNRWTDRLYLVDDRGIVQCLRRTGAELPHFNATIMTEPPVDADAPSIDPAKQTPMAGFGAGPAAGGVADPFGAGAGTDPFAPGAGSDPFAPGAGDDPFAPKGGDDPFGGGF